MAWAQQNCPVNVALRAVWAIDANTVVAVGDAGTIVRTTNGGAAWSTVASGTTYNLNGVCFATSTTGWIAGANGVLLKSTNGGANWASDPSGVTGTFRAHSAILVAAGIRALAVGDSGLGRVYTGTGWSGANHPNSHPLRSISIVSSTIGQGWEGWAARSPSGQPLS